MYNKIYHLIDITALLKQTTGHDLITVEIQSTFTYCGSFFSCYIATGLHHHYITIQDNNRKKIHVFRKGMNTC